MAEPGTYFPQLGNRASGSQKKEFKRAYMACIPCRKTKAKCEIADDSTACVKCRRERRECVFSTERSTKKRRKTGESENVQDGKYDDSNEDTEKPSDSSQARDRTKEFHGISHNTNPSGQFSVAAGKITPGPSSAVIQPLSPLRFREDDGIVTNHGSGQNNDADDTRPRPQYRPSRPNLEADVMRTVVSSSKDALGLLFKAAEQQYTDESDEVPNDPANMYDSPESALTSAAPPPVAPSILSNPSQNILDLWGHSRFVRQGWFSAREAVTYVDLFFCNLSHLSPISDTFFSNHENHKDLILQEPLLCCTILMISSRYHVLPGYGGTSRAHFIHARLWRHLEHLIQRITFGQEKYSVARSRTLGSITALLLLTEWNPRSLHFPPANDGWDSSLAPSIDESYGSASRTDDTILKRWREEVFEPAKRSDRMAWMMLGLANSLAHELGVFADSDSEGDGAQTIKVTHTNLRVRRLLYLNVNQLALRIGCTSFLPQSGSQVITTPLTRPNDPDCDRDKLISLWIDITKLLTTAADMFFSSKASTRQLLKSGRYVGLLEHFQPMLSQWLVSFNNFKTSTLSEAALKLLYIDYQYVRMYINSLAIQALVERTTSRSGSQVNLEYDILKAENRQDYKYVQEVIEAARAILAKAVALADNGILRLGPVRLFLRITSASIFLLKAISLGMRNSELSKSLDLLDRCIHALRFSTLDDIHLSARYAVLIERHVRRFRRNFRVRSGLGALTVPTSPRQSAPPQPNLPAAGAPTNTIPTFENAGTDSLNTFYGPFDPNLPSDDWLVQPFDPSIAPFGLGVNQSASGLELESLDFLWNMAA